MKKLKLFLLSSFVSLASVAQPPVAYYPFSGNANDASGNGNNPIANNATLTTDRFGNPNSAYHFNGVNNSIEIPNSATLNMNNQISLCAWVRVTGFYAGTCHGNSIMMKGNADYLPGNYFLRFDDHEFTSGMNCSGIVVDPQHQTFYGSGAGVRVPGPYIQTNQWNSIVYTYDGATIKFYMNCILRDSVAATNLNFTNADNLFLGRLNDGSFPYWLNGDLDDVTIYNRPLSQAEVNVYGGCAVVCPTDITVNRTKCSNQNITLNARAGSTYSWTPSTGLSSATVQNPVCFANTNTTYTVTISDSNCTYHDIFNVVVNAAPFSNIHDTTICIGDTLQLVAFNGTSYSWSPNYNINNTTIFNPLVWPTVTTNYVVNITNASGCSTKDTVKVTVSNCHCEDSCSWSLTGNLNVLPRNFIGSINNADFKIRTNNTPRMIVQAGGNVGIGTTTPGKLLEVHGEARIFNLPLASPNESLVFANGSGDLHKLNTSGNTNQYLSGDGTWQNMPPPSGGITSAGQGLTINGTSVVLGDYCKKGGGEFKSSREVNMNGYNLYFNSARSGKLYMGNTTPIRENDNDCMPLETRLEISSRGLEAQNSYAEGIASTSGLRFSDLTALTEPIDNRYGGVLSLDADGDVIWVRSCCAGGVVKDAQINEILERLTKLENELKASKEEAATLKGQLNQMDIVLSKNNMIVLNQNVPNPFGDNTVITYVIPKTFRQAQIIFTSVNGEVIKTAEIKESGKGQVNVFAKDISNGLYTYTLIVDGKIIDTKKMIKQ